MDIISLTFVIIIVVVFIFIITINIKKSQQKRNKVYGSSNNQLNGDGNTNITVGTINNQLILPQKEQSKQELFIDQIKSELKVIFVDDKKFNIVNLLKKNGWKQISYKNDISDLDDPEIREAHVIFLDINGVGIAMNFQNQGMGLCGAIKRKYGNKKRVVLYSGETDGSIFDSDAKMADDTLVKDSDYYQFIYLMEQYGKELL
ncbi:MAG: hypothetical protein U0L37_03530 [Bacteroidales bacterium]|nr:hypothetical protein [Bacteroidales bacterium]